MDEKNKKPVRTEFLKDILKLKEIKFESIEKGKFTNESCQKLIDFSNELADKILETSTNKPFKIDLKNYIQALKDQELNPTDNNRETSFKELKDLILERLNEVRDVNI